MGEALQRIHELAGQSLSNPHLSVEQELELPQLFALTDPSRAGSHALNFQEIRELRLLLPKYGRVFKQVELFRRAKDELDSIAPSPLKPPEDQYAARLFANAYLLRGENFPEALAEALNGPINDAFNQSSLVGSYEDRFTSGLGSAQLFLENPRRILQVSYFDEESSWDPDKFHYQQQAIRFKVESGPLLSSQDIEVLIGLFYKTPSLRAFLLTHSVQTIYFSDSRGDYLKYDVFPDGEILKASRLHGRLESKEGVWVTEKKVWGDDFKPYGPFREATNLLRSVSEILGQDDFYSQFYAHEMQPPFLIVWRDEKTIWRLHLRQASSGKPILFIDQLYSPKHSGTGLQLSNSFEALLTQNNLLGIRVSYTTQDGNKVLGFWSKGNGEETFYYTPLPVDSMAAAALSLRDRRRRPPDHAGADDIMTSVTPEQDPSPPRVVRITINDPVSKAFDRAVVSTLNLVRSMQNPSIKNLAESLKKIKDNEDAEGRERLMSLITQWAKQTDTDLNLREIPSQDLLIWVAQIKGVSLGAREVNGLVTGQSSNAVLVEESVGVKVR